MVGCLVKVGEEGERHVTFIGGFFFFLYFCIFSCHLNGAVSCRKRLRRCKRVGSLPLPPLVLHLSPVLQDAGFPGLLRFEKKEMDVCDQQNNKTTNKERTYFISLL